MTRHLKQRVGPTLWLILMPVSVTVFAQDPVPAGGSETEPEDPSRETDVSEDNYRRFMELDDRRLERPAFPVASVQSATTLQKLGQLPEASQKHLRNQLRGIILRRGAWTPDERDASYPFVPSPQARDDAQLMRQEAEAWTELVDEYHDREAAILAGAAGQPSREDGGATSEQSASDASAQQARAGSVAGRNPGTNAQQGANAPPGQEGREGAQGERGTDDEAGAEAGTTSQPAEQSEAPEWVTEETAGQPPAPRGDEGVEQNASEYLQARGLAGSSPIDLQGARAGTTPAGVERASRWGEESQTLLEDRSTTTVSSRQRTTPLPASDGAEAEAPPNSLTREQLQRVRGVTEASAPQEEAFGALDLEVSSGPVQTEAGGARRETDEERRDESDPDDDGRP